MEYASEAEVKALNTKANVGVALGSVGTGLAAIAGAGGLAGILGIGRNPNPANMPEGDRPVTRYEMGLIQANNQKDNEITLLKSQQYVDRAMAGVQMQFGQQTAWNAVQGANIQALKEQLAGITKTVVPNDSVMPGWGNVAVVPVPPVLPTSGTQSDSSTATSTSNKS